MKRRARAPQGRGGALSLVLCGLCACAGSESPPPVVEMGPIPLGVRTVTVQTLSNQCGLELKQGQSFQVLITPSGAGVEFAVTDASLQMPTLIATALSGDRFQTVDRKSGITSQGGACQGQRREWYVGSVQSSTAYQIDYQVQDSMPTGTCTETRIPCASVATLVLPFCPGRTACP